MIFITISPKQAEQYSYICLRLKQMVDKMYTARKTLEAIANTSFDKSFSKCVYMFTSESLQCENEIRSQIDSLSCFNYEDNRLEGKKILPLNTKNGLESVCNYCEKAYLKPYRKLLNDKHIGNSLKSLMQNHLRLFMSCLTQLRLFNDVKTEVNLN